MNWFELALLKGIYPVAKAKSLTNDWETVEVSGTNSGQYLRAILSKSLDLDATYLVKLSIYFSAENTDGNQVYSKSTHLFAIDTSEFSEDSVIYGSKVRIPITESHFIDISTSNDSLILRAYNYDGSDPLVWNFEIKEMKVKKIM